MPSIPAALRALKNRLANPTPYIWLIEVRVPSDPPTMLRITPNPQAVTCGSNAAGDPIVWAPFPVGMGTLEQDSEGGTAEFAITVGGATREIMALLLAYDLLVGAPVKLHLVHADLLDDPAQRVTVSFEIATVNGDEEAVTFGLSTENLYNWFMPADRIHRDFCGFTYKGIECGFFGDPSDTLGDCARVRSACVLRGDWEVANGYTRQHPARFGGAPALVE